MSPLGGGIGKQTHSEANLFHDIALIHLPSLSHVQHGIEVVIRVGSGTKKATLIAAITHDDLVNNVFQMCTTRPDYCQKRYSVSKTLFNEVVEQPFVGHGRVKDEL
jgi:hypothetical protein